MARWFVDRSPQRGIPTVSLRRLLPEARFVRGSDLEVTGCSTDTRRIEPGQLFVAMRGRRHDGHDFVGRALENGAAGVLVERVCQEAGRLQVVVPNSREAHARIVHALAGDPSDKLRVVGVTGSRGKTATSLFLRSILETAGIAAGSVGSLGWSDGRIARPISPAFPSAEALATMLTTIAGRGAAAALVEFSEQALVDSSAAEGIRLETAVVTHADHDDPREHVDARSARRRAFARLTRRVSQGGTLIVNADDPDAEILGASNLGASRVSFGLDPSADISALIDAREGNETRFRLRGLAGDAVVRLRFGDADRVRQALAACAAAWSMGIDSKDIVAGLERVHELPGRFQAVDEGQPFEVRIDQARTPRQLAKALSDLRALRPDGRIICVIGSEGLTDRSARRVLAQVAESGSDQLVLTTDNPRAEDPGRIFEDLLGGCRKPGAVVIEQDRGTAIERAIRLAEDGDAVLIAGKGRRGFQILADRVIPFDDRAVASRAIRTVKRIPLRGRESA